MRHVYSVREVHCTKDFLPYELSVSFLAFLVSKVISINFLNCTYLYRNRSAKFHLPIKFRIKQINVGNGRHMQMEHLFLWVDEILELKSLLLVINSIAAFQATNPETADQFHGINGNLLLTEMQIDRLSPCRRPERASFVPCGTFYNIS